MDEIINILLPNGKIYQIKDYLTKNFNYIIQCLQKEGIYYSYNCENNNFHIIYLNEELPRIGCPLKSAKSGEFLKVKMSGNVIDLKYGNYRFFLSENDNSYDAQSLITKALRLNENSSQCFLIDIIDKNDNTVYYLKSTEEYKIVVKALFMFFNIDGGNYASFHVDYLSTVIDIKEPLSKEIKKYYGTVDPANIIIYDNSKEKIKDTKIPLSSIQKLSKDFYYEIIKNKIDKKPSEIESKNAQNFKIKSIYDDFDPDKEPKTEMFSFYLNGERKTLKFNIESTLGDNEQKIREKFYISDDDEITFNILDDLNKTIIAKKDQKMKTFIRKCIFISKISKDLNQKKISYEKENKVRFERMDGIRHVNINADNKTTISDAINAIFNEISRYYDESFKKDHLVIFNYNREEIKILNEPLVSIQKLDRWFYYAIDKTRGSSLSAGSKQAKTSVYFGDYFNVKHAEIISLYNSSTVMDAVNGLLENIRAYDNTARPENLFLYNEHRKAITDPNRLLSNVQDLNKKFYYEVSSYKKSTFKSEPKLTKEDTKLANKGDEKAIKKKKPKEEFFTFVFKNISVIKNFDVETPLKKIEPIIKQKFSIDEKEDVNFIHVNKNHEELIKNKEEKMINFKDGSIRLTTKSSEITEPSEYIVNFYNYSGIYNIQISINNKSTVKDAVKKLSEKLSVSYKPINPENLIIYDCYKERITDLNKPFITIKNFDKYFIYRINDPTKSTFISEPEPTPSSAREEKETILVSDDESKDLVPKKSASKKYTVFKYKYEGNESRKSLISDTLLKDLIIEIKEEFEIDFKEELVFKFVTKSGTEKIIENLETPIESFKEGIVHISSKSPKFVKFNDLTKKLKPLTFDANNVPTVSSAYKIIASKLSSLTKTTVNIDDLALFNEEFDEISYSANPLYKEQSLNKDFYFQIIKVQSPIEAKKEEEEEETITIIFIFEDCFEKHINPMKRNIKLNSTIKEIQQFISSVNNIKEPISIKYKKKSSGTSIPLDLNLKVSDVRNLIECKESNGSISNTMFVSLQFSEQTKENKKKKPIVKPSIRSNSDSDKEDDDVNDNRRIIRRNKNSDSDSGETYSPKPYNKNSPKINKKKVNEKNLIRKRNESPPESIEKVEQKIGTIKPPKRNLSAVRPKKKEIELSPEEKKTSQKFDTFNFEYNGIKRKFKFLKESTLESHEKLIRNSFYINEDDSIIFTFTNDNDDDEIIEDKNKPMKKFVEGIIQISLNKPKQKKSKSKNEADSNKIKYFYQLINDGEDFEIELDPDATVLTLKEKIAEKHEFDNISLIKIIFASKELLDDIELGPMEIGDTQIFVYYPPVEEVLLLTAKALKNKNIKNEEVSDDDDIY